MRRWWVTQPGFRRHLAILTVLLSPVFGLLTGCGDGDPQGPEAQIKSIIAQAEQAAQQRDIGTLRDFVADAYLDARGYSKRAIVRLTQGYLLRHRSVHLYTQVTDFALIEPGRASTSVLVAMAGRRVESAEQLWNLRADVYRFELLWSRAAGNWQVTRSTWRRVSVDDFFSN